MTTAAQQSILRYAHVVGDDRMFAPHVMVQLRGKGVRIVADLAALSDEAALDALIVDLTMITVDVPFRSVTDDQFRASLDGGLYVFVDAVQAVVRRMTAGGSIVIIVPKAYLGAWGGVHVAASAAACVAMARSMAIELAPRGIRVNCVATGRPGDAWDTAQARADVAATVAWLAVGDSGQITGETILADRGASLQMAQAIRR